MNEFKVKNGLIVDQGGAIITGSLVAPSITGSLQGTSSYALVAQTLLGSVVSASYASTASYINPLQQNVLITGSLNISGSTVQIGNNSLLGNTTLSGSITISGNTLITGSITALNVTASFGYVSASFVDVTGKQSIRGYAQFYPTSDTVPVTVPGGYIYSSGSQGDLYFSQTNGVLNNTIRLRWLEGNMYSGLLYGGLITTQSSTVYQVSSGSGIIATMNVTLNSEPYPTVEYFSWPNLSASIAPLTASYDQSFISIEQTGSLGKIFAQGTPYNDGQFNTLIPIGNVIHQNRSTINATATYPSVAYAFKQRTNDFIRAFGALKLSGLNTIVSGSSIGSLLVTSGTSYAEGRNYPVDPNNPSYVVDSGSPTSKIYRYYQSGSAWVYLTNGGAGYATIDPTQYSLNGVLTAVPGTGANRRWTIQRVYYFPGGATKGIYVYYGNETYATQVEATANIPFEDFNEAPNTAASAVLSSYLVVRNNADFTDTTSYHIQQGGLFRNVGGSGGGGATITQTLAGLSDVSISGPTTGQPLVYNGTSLKWENASTLTANLVGSASYAATSSYADNFTVAGTLTAQTLVVQTITSSTEYVTGSTKFGSLTTDTHQFTGSVSISGSESLKGTLNIVPAINSSSLVSTGYNVTGSGTTSMIDLSGSWDTTGAPTAIKLNITSITSSASSNLIDLQVGGSSVFKVAKSGAVTSANNMTANTFSAGNFNLHSTYGFSTFATNTPLPILGATFNTTSGTQNGLSYTSTFSPTSGTGIFNGFSIVNTINQTGGANGITRGLYINPTLTAAADFRAIETTQGRVILADTYAASGSLSGSLLDMTQTWNTAGNVTGIKYNAINTLSGASSALMDLQVGGVSQYYFQKAGNLTLGAATPRITFNTSGYAFIQSVGSLMQYSAYNVGVSHTMQPFGASNTATAGDNGILQLTSAFAPTSGTATFFGGSITPTINQTGGANGITRGLYIAPTLTSAADFRAIETTAGKVVFNGTSNVLIGTTTDEGYKLDVNGTTRLQGAVTAPSITGSLQGTASLATTASYVKQAVSASYASTASLANGVTGGTTGYVPKWNGNALVTSSIYSNGGGFTAIGYSGSPEDPANPETLYVQNTINSSYNLISAHSDTNNYTQINIKNYNAGVSASADIVATADNGDEFTKYIDMGINSSTHDVAYSGVGFANDAYVYSTGNDLLIGNATPNKKVIIFNGGSDAAANARVYIDDNGTVGINTVAVTAGNPEALLVESISATTYNLISARANVDNYTQFNIKNTNTGNNASTDIVVTNDEGSETHGYADFGINSTTYNVVDGVGGPGDAYLYSKAHHFHIGNASTGSLGDLYFFTGGSNTDSGSRMVIKSTGLIAIGNMEPTYSLDISGSVRANQLALNSGNKIVFDVNVDSFHKIFHDSLDTMGYGDAMIYTSNGSNPHVFMNPEDLSLTGVAMGSLYVNTIWTGQPYTFDLNGNGRIQSGLSVTGSLVAPSITGSLQGTASYATVAQTLLGSVVSASYAATASQATTSSYALVAQTLLGSVVSASYAATASQATTSSYALVAQTLLGSVVSASYAATASIATTSSYALVAQTLLGSVVSASYATTASQATSASYALTSSYSPGMLTTGAQIIEGEKTFTGSFLNINGVGFPTSGLKIKSTNTGGAAYAHFEDANGQYFDFGKNASGLQDAYFYTNSAIPINFYTNNTVRLTISGSGVVTLSNLAGTGNRMVVTDASGNLTSSAIPSGGSPAGNTGEIQYNNAGSFGGAANVEIASGNLQLVSTTDPSAPSAGNIILYSKDIAGRQMPKWIGPSGVDTPIQANMAFNQVSLIGPGGGTTVGTLNCTVTSVGTISNPNIAVTNLKTQTRRIVNTSGATAGNLASTRIASLECWRGNAAGVGGFFTVARFGFTTLQTGQRMFIGLDSNATAAPTNIDYLTSTTTAKIGMYATGSTGNWSLINNTAAAVPTVLPLGASFPIDTTSLLEMILFAKPNDTVVTYRITNLSTNVAVSGSLASNLPASTTPLGRLIAGCNNATAAAMAWDLSRFSLETDY
jgi:hypothetical protein